METQQGFLVYDGLGIEARNNMADILQMTQAHNSKENWAYAQNDT